MDVKQKTAIYRILSDGGGKRYQFFCALSGGLGCTTQIIPEGTENEELSRAWEEGRAHFNQCHKCGRWVSDVMYNADVLECVDCAPWEECPSYCCKCGTQVEVLDTYCRRCGARLRYGEVWK